jgi:hypothetical protein
VEENWLAEFEKVSNSLSRPCAISSYHRAGKVHRGKTCCNFSVYLCEVFLWPNLYVATYIHTSEGPAIPGNSCLLYTEMRKFLPQAFSTTLLCETDFKTITFSVVWPGDVDICCAIKIGTGPLDLVPLPLIYALIYALNDSSCLYLSFSLPSLPPPTFPSPSSVAPQYCPLFFWLTAKAGPQFVSDISLCI